MAPGASPGGGPGPDEATLREVIETLAPLERRAGSEDERRAAEWIAQRLRAAGCEAEVQEEQKRAALERWADHVERLVR